MIPHQHCLVPKSENNIILQPTHIVNVRYFNTEIVKDNKLIKLWLLIEQVSINRDRDQKYTSHYLTEILSRSVRDSGLLH